MPYVSNVPSPTWKLGVKVTPYWSERKDCFQWNWDFTQKTVSTVFGSCLCLKAHASFCDAHHIYVKSISQATLIYYSKNRRFYWKKYSDGINYVLSYYKVLCCLVWIILFCHSFGNEKLHLLVCYLFYWSWGIQYIGKKIAKSTLGSYLPGLGAINIDICDLWATYFFGFP